MHEQKLCTVHAVRSRTQLISLAPGNAFVTIAAVEQRTEMMQRLNKYRRTVHSAHCPRITAGHQHLFYVIISTNKYMSVLGRWHTVKLHTEILSITRLRHNSILSNSYHSTDSKHWTLRQHREHNLIQEHTHIDITPTDLCWTVPQVQNKPLVTNGLLTSHERYGMAITMWRQCSRLFNTMALTMSSSL